MASMASIPAEILILIFTYLNCFADLSSVAGVCKDWRNAVHVRLRASQQEEPRYRQLPWLLQPSYDDAPPSTITSFVSGTTGRRFCLPEGIRRRDRFCGSHDGGWVAVAADRRGPHYELVNLINQAIARIPLPSTLRSRSHVVEIRMVTLSDVPTAKSCIAAAHTAGGYPSIIFCRPHVDCHWLPPLMDTELLHDTLYHRGEVYQGFYAISNRDNLYVFLPNEINNGESETLVMRQLIISFQPVLATRELSMAGSSTITRYLVESRGKLLLVVRYSGTATGTTDLRTLHFRVFEMELNPLPNGGHAAARWVELDYLDGRVITVARGCSRAFEAVHYIGFQGGSIYFLDDAVGPGRMHSIFSFADLGMYSMGETKIERPGLPTPALRGCLDGAQGRSAPRHPSTPQATELERLRWLRTPHSDLAWDGRAEHLRMLAGCEPSSNSPYGPRELMMVRTIRNVSRATRPTPWVSSRLQIVTEIIDHVANHEASSSTSAGGEQVVRETVASVWPLLFKPGNRRPVWLLPPSADEWLLPPPPADA